MALRMLSCAAGLLVAVACGSSHGPPADGGSEVDAESAEGGGGDAGRADGGGQDSGLPSCGGLGGATCGRGEWCQYEGESCGAGDATGVCRPSPEACSAEYAPVCGCDGTTYGNECSAHGAGVDVLHAGECDASGRVDCDPRDVRCDAPTPSCPEGQVPSVSDGCWGGCVAITECRCASAEDCPMRERYTCHGGDRCGYYL